MKDQIVEIKAEDLDTYRRAMIALVKVREIFANFDWECDDHQYALESIEQAVS
jgi:hypothetical protein